MTFGEPMNDETGFSESSQPDDNGFRGMHRTKFDKFAADGDVYPSGIARKSKMKTSCILEKGAGSVVENWGSLRDSDVIHWTAA